jgi:hypothetical protein
VIFVSNAPRIVSESVKRKNAWIPVGAAPRVVGKWLLEVSDLLKGYAVEARSRLKRAGAVFVWRKRNLVVRSEFLAQAQSGR